MVKENIAKMEAALEQLKAAGADLFADEIKNLQVRIENTKAEAAAAVDQAVDDVKTAEQNFVQKYGAAIVKGVELVLLGLITGRILGVI